MGLPAGRLGQPIFTPSPTQNAGMEYGGSPFTQSTQKQAIPAQTMPNLTMMPESLPQFTSQEADVLKKQFMDKFGSGMGGPFGSGSPFGGMF